MTSKPSTITVILGPTASGKTDEALTLAKKTNGFVISADSRQVYRGMDIGTAKPVQDTQKSKKQITNNKNLTPYYVDGVPHFCIDCVHPNEPFSVANFQSITYTLLEDTTLLQNYPTAIIAGGTGLYIQSILDNYVFPSQSDTAIKAELEKLSLEELQTNLATADPETFAKIDIQNTHRLIRALTHLQTTGKSFITAQQKNISPYTFEIYGLAVEKEALHQRINTRVESMITKGLIEEVETLLKKYQSDLPALQTIGYAEVIDYLQGTISKSKMIELIQTHTRQYAKRQMTWFKRDKRIQWVKKITK